MRLIIGLYNYWLLFTNFFNLDLFFVGDVVLDLSVSAFDLLNSAIIFSASFVSISLETRLFLI